MYSLPVDSLIPVAAGPSIRSCSHIFVMCWSHWPAHQTLRKSMLCSTSRQLFTCVQVWSTTCDFENTQAPTCFWRPDSQFWIDSDHSRRSASLRCRTQMSWDCELRCRLQVMESTLSRDDGTDWGLFSPESFSTPDSWLWESIKASWVRICAEWWEL